MGTAVFALQILVSVLFFSQKCLVLFGKKSGWVFGAIAAALGVAYFSFLGMYVYVVLEFGLLVLMGYQVYAGEHRDSRIEIVIRIVTAVVMLIIVIIAFNGLMTAMEFVSAAAMLPGTYFLARSRKRLGWGLNAVAHVAAMYLAFEKGQQIFLVFQGLSVLVSGIGVIVPVITFSFRRARA